MATTPLSLMMHSSNHLHCSSFDLECGKDNAFLWFLFCSTFVELESVKGKNASYRFMILPSKNSSTQCVVPYLVPSLALSPSLFDQ